MNETYQQALSEILLSTIGTVKEAKDFVLAELPDVVQQLLMWKMVESIFYSVLSLSLVVISVFYWRWVIKSRNADWTRELRNKNEPSDSYMAAVIVGGIVTALVVAPIVLINFNFDWVQILVAPKIYLIEYVAELVK